MHELGIAQDLWAVVKQEAQKNKLRTLKKITVIVGEASGIEADFLRHSLVDHILPQAGEFAAGAEVELLAEKLTARCANCSAEITKDNLITFHCPACGSMKIDIIAGKETYVKSIEGE